MAYLHTVQVGLANVQGSGISDGVSDVVSEKKNLDLDVQLKTETN